MVNHDINIAVVKSLRARYNNQQYLTRQRDAQISRPIEEVYQILDDWEHTEELEQRKFLRKYGIKQSCFNWWIKKYRPELRGLVDRKRISIIKDYQSSMLSKQEYGEKYNLWPGTITEWEKKYNLERNFNVTKYSRDKFLDFIQALEEGNINKTNYKKYRRYVLMSRKYSGSILNVFLTDEQKQKIDDIFAEFGYKRVFTDE